MAPFKSCPIMVTLDASDVALLLANRGRRRWDHHQRRLRTLVPQQDDAQRVPGAVDDHAEVDILLPAHGIDRRAEGEDPAEHLPLRPEVVRPRRGDEATCACRTWWPRVAPAPAAPQGAQPRKRVPNSRTRRTTGTDTIGTMNDRQGWCRHQPIARPTSTNQEAMIK